MTALPTNDTGDFDAHVWVCSYNQQVRVCVPGSPGEVYELASLGGLADRLDWYSLVINLAQVGKVITHMYVP